MRETIYKGATRPVLLFGVPLTYAVLVLLGGIGIGMNLFVLTRSLTLLAAFIVVTAATLGWMYVATRRDDQKVDQRVLRWSMRPTRRARQRWGCNSHAPGPSRRSRQREQIA